jgi:DNA-binding transcriptional MerR regulator
MTDEIRSELRLAELAEKSGVPARTIRLYIARGVLDGPSKLGRAAAYTQAHLSRLRQIQELQAKGITLAEIARTFAAPDAAAIMPSPESWTTYAVSEDVVVMVRGTPAPWRRRSILKSISRMASELTERETEREADDERGQ